MKWREWFRFSARERMGVLVLLVLIVLVYSVPFWKGKLLPGGKPGLNEQQLVSLVERMKGEKLVQAAERADQYNTSRQEKKEYPGRGRTEWYTSQKSRQSYQGKKYQERGGYKNENKRTERKEYVSGNKPPPFIDINQAAATEWDQLPGIGPVLSARIVAFRDKLGGFVSLEQVAQTYGLPDSVFRTILPYLKENSAGVKRIRFNNASEEELAAHPAIRWKLAKQLVAYRKQHGGIHSEEELGKLLALDSVAWKRLVGYLDFGE